MAIQRVKGDTVISAGQWINKDPMWRDAICGYPRMVVKASGQRVYFTNRHGEDEGDYCAKKTVAFVSDTKEEAEVLHSISQRQEKALMEASKEIRAEHTARIEALIAGKGAA